MTYLFTYLFTCSFTDIQSPLTQIKMGQKSPRVTKKQEHGSIRSLWKRPWRYKGTFWDENGHFVVMIWTISGLRASCPQRSPQGDSLNHIDVRLEMFHACQSSRFHAKWNAHLKMHFHLQLQNNDFRPIICCCQKILNHVCKAEPRHFTTYQAW